MLVVALAALVQGGAWSTWPPSPTVGDTVWIERHVAAPAGWRVRPGRFEPTDEATPLTEPAVLRDANGWLVRYAVALWTPGSVRLALPALWRLGPGGEADSLDPGSAVVVVRSVLPAAPAPPPPRPALAPVWPAVTRPVYPVVAATAAGVVLAAAIAWRRRRPAAVPAPAAPVADPPVADGRWLAAGEPRAVAARAMADLRLALARGVPDALPSLSTAEVLAVTARALPDAAQHELAEVLTALDQVGFAAVHGAAVAPLAARARDVARRLAP